MFKTFVLSACIDFLLMCTTVKVILLLFATLMGIHVFALQENIFEWQFAIRGPCDSEFEGGIYHGRIQLPADYPFKPPSFMLLTVMFWSLHG